MNNFFYNHLLDEIADLYKLSEDQTYSLIMYLAKQHGGDKTRAAKHVVQHADKAQIESLIRSITPPAEVSDISSGLPVQPRDTFAVPVGQRLSDGSGLTN